MRDLHNLEMRRRAQERKSVPAHAGRLRSGMRHVLRLVVLVLVVFVVEGVFVEVLVVVGLFSARIDLVDQLVSERNVPHAGPLGFPCPLPGQCAASYPAIRRARRLFARWTSTRSRDGSPQSGMFSGSTSGMFCGLASGMFSGFASGMFSGSASGMLPGVVSPRISSSISSANVAFTMLSSRSSWRGAFVQASYPVAHIALKTFS